MDLEKLRQTVLKAEHTGSDGAMFDGNIYSRTNEAGAMGAYQFLPLWKPIIKEFAEKEGYKYDSDDDFLQNSMFQDEFFNHVIETQAKPQIKTLKKRIDIPNGISDEQLYALIHYLGYPRLKEIVKSGDFNQEVFGVSPNEYLQRGGIEPIELKQEYKPEITPKPIQTRVDNTRTEIPLTIEEPAEIEDNSVPLGLEEFQDGGEKKDSTLNNIYTKYPALKNMGNIYLHPDTSFTKEKTGVGDIEYFSPEQDTITYPNDFQYPNPNKGTHTVVYNPNTNTEQTIMLDMLHGMASDSTYNDLRNRFKKSFENSKFNEDLKHEWESYNKETKGKNDGFEQFKENWIDGQIRNLLFEGDYEKYNYWKDAKKVYLANPDINKNFQNLKSYLTTGEYKDGGKILLTL